MQSKDLLKHQLFIGSISGTVLFLIVILFLGLPSAKPENVIANKPAEAMQNVSGEQTDAGLPIRLKIPKINVDALVDYVGIAPDGTMDIPKGPFEVAWFKLGQRPGEIGSAVIDGHYGLWKNGDASVFDDLYKLQTGDKIYVEDDHGSVISFVVRESKVYKPDANTSEIFSSKDGIAHLNLITCGGVWNEARKSYSNRLIVFTDKEMNNNYDDHSF